MENFDRLCEEITKYNGKRRTTSRTENEPKWEMSDEFKTALAKEYLGQKDAVGNRNFNSNFMKKLGFVINQIKDDPTYSNTEDESSDIPLEAWDEVEFLNWEDPPYVYTATVETFTDAGTRIIGTGTFSSKKLVQVDDIEVMGD